MRNPMQLPPIDWRSEAWWERALEGELSAQEAQLWEAHLAECAQCRQEWAALQQVDALLRAAPPPPVLDAGFTARVATRAAQKQRLRSLLTFLGSALIICLVSWTVLRFLGSTYLSLEHILRVVFLERQMLFNTLMRTALDLLTAWKIFLPFCVGLAGLSFLLLMPNSVLATALLVWLSRRKSASLAGMN